jgi:tRNA (guanosine-2'-O-)-methyltransferase
LVFDARVSGPSTSGQVQRTLHDRTSGLAFPLFRRTFPPMHGPDVPPTAALTAQRDLPSPIPAHPLDGLLTPERARKYRQVLARRTGRLVLVVEDCFDPHNATAIVRTCDAFGIHRVVVVAGRNPFKVNRKVSQGSHFYVDVQVFPTITEAYAALRADGFRILVSDLAAQAIIGPERLKATLAEQPLALVFGNEGSGVTPEASAQADGFFLIPMSGFPQSLNLSVSAAITAYTLRQDSLSNDLPGDLSPETQCACYDQWVRRHTGEKGETVLRQLRQDVGKFGEELDVIAEATKP